MRANNNARKKAKAEYAKALQAEKEASIKSIEETLQCLERITTAKPRQLVESFQTDLGTSGRIVNTYRLHGLYRRQFECLSMRLAKELDYLKAIPIEILEKGFVSEEDQGRTSK